MSIPDQIGSQLRAFPPALRLLVDAEVAAGNQIVEVSGGFPAPPVGACVWLEQRVSTRSRASAGEVVFYERNSSSYSGEWTDAKRFYFVLEPPLPLASEAARAAVPENRIQPPSVAGEKTAPVVPSRRSSPRVERFRASMVMDYEKWHDGIGYDVALLADLTAAERSEIEQLLVPRAAQNWRDIETLAALQSERATAALRTAFTTGNAEIRQAVLRFAPALVTEQERIAHLVTGLGEARFYEGLTQVLDEVATLHPPAVVAALWRGVREREGEVAGHFAAMLMYVHGRAAVPFDWTHRPFFLAFVATKPGAERDRLVRELNAKISTSGLEPESGD